MTGHDPVKVGDTTYYGGDPDAAGKKQWKDLIKLIVGLSVGLPILLILLCWCGCYFYRSKKWNPWVPEDLLRRAKRQSRGHGDVAPQG